MNKLEQKAVWNLFSRIYGTEYESNKQLVRYYRAFRRKFYYSHMGCWIIPDWCGMLIGIESDGYTHS